MIQGLLSQESLSAAANLMDSITHSMVVPFCLITLFLLILLIYMNRSSFNRMIRRVDKKTWVILFIIFLSALGVRLFLTPHFHMVWFHEFLYMQAGKEILQTGYQGDYIKSIGWPVVLSGIFRIFGTSNYVALYASSVIGALTVIMVFLLAYAMTRNQGLSIIAAIIFSLYPAHVLRSGSAETNVVSLFFVTLAFFFEYIYYVEKKDSIFWLSLISISFASLFRPENYWLFPLFLVGCILYVPRFLAGIGKTKISALAIAFGLSIPNLFSIIELFSVYVWFPGKVEASIWSIHNILVNSPVLARDLFFGRSAPFFLIPFLIVGAYYLFFLQKKHLIFLGSWFIFNWIIISLSSFIMLGGPERLFINFYVVCSIVIAYGILALSTNISRLCKRPTIAIILPIAILLLIAVYSVPLYSSPMTTQYDILKLETDVIEQAERDLPSECVIVTTLPVVLTSTTDLKVYDWPDFVRYERQQIQLNSSGCVLFYDGFACQDYEMFPVECKRYKEMFMFEEYKSYNNSRARSTFYRIIGKAR
jgi:hypothetical protein